MRFVEDPDGGAPRAKSINGQCSKAAGKVVIE